MARIRTFIGIPLDSKIRDKIVALQERLADIAPEVKWVEPDNLHVTLLFLGEVVDRELHSVCCAVAEACQGHEPFHLSVEKAGCFPTVRRPRVLWVGIGEGLEEVVALHDALEPPLLELGCYRREERQYSPHLTLGRVKSDQENDRLGQEFTGKLQKWQGGQMLVKEVHVFSSELTREGPMYTVLSRVKLA